jgi:ABC-2 type transport system permease protein
MNRKDLKKQNLIQLITTIAIILLALTISAYTFFRIDLTQEKRYTLSSVSKEILKSLPNQLVIKVYLDGDLPKGFKKLNQSVKEMLDEFRIYAGNNIQYIFIDPYESNDKSKTQALIEELDKQGLKPTSVKIKDEKGGYSEKLIIPGALVNFNGISFPVNLLSNNPGLTGEENLNNSAQELEYALINAIHCVSNTKLEKVAFIEGHGEYNQYQTNDITRELANYYQVDRGAINGNAQTLKPYKCIIIANPNQPFSEEDKYVIDQYIMNGGKVLWFVDPVSINQDSIAYGSTLANIAQINIDDQLFKYGIRLNPSLLQDVQCGLLPVNNGLTGTQSKFVPAPWLYYPLFSGNTTHPVSRNINMVKSEYSGYIDTLAVTGLKHQVLLASSKFSRIKTVPSFVYLKEIKQQHSRESFDKSYLPVAVIVEGVFTSVFKNRITDGLKLKSSESFLQSSVPNKMLVVADADIIRNDFRESQQGIMISKLGRDKYTGQIFGNKDFILNAVNYLADDLGLLNLRTREVKLRLLDKNRIADDLFFWQLINVLMPILLVVGTGIGIVFWRKKQYAR